MAFGTRQCCCLALLLVITQVMLSTAYNPYPSNSRDDDYGSNGYSGRRQDHGSHDRDDYDRKSSHDTGHHENDGHDHGREHDSNAATSAKAMFQTMLVGTSLVLYWL